MFCLNHTCCFDKISVWKKSLQIFFTKKVTKRTGINDVTAPYKWQQLGHSQNNPFEWSKYQLADSPICTTTPPKMSLLDVSDLYDGLKMLLLICIYHCRRFIVRSSCSWRDLTIWLLSSFATQKVLPLQKVCFWIYCLWTNFLIKELLCSN